jgi:CheY-like chemotaxis protein
MTNPRWPWADRAAAAAPGGSLRSPGSRTVVLIGFSSGLEDALSVILSSDYSVLTAANTAQAMELLETLRVDLFIASSRCSVASVVKLTESLGQPREARVVVLLAGPDPAAERVYRAAGLQYVLHMPVRADELLQLRTQPPGQQS